jgi:hypothetical protein
MANLTLRTLTRAGDTTKNAPLTNAEVDNNFINLDADLDLKANIDSPGLTGVPTAPTAAPGTNTTQIATTAYTFAGLALKANIDSPTLTGTPAAPTAAPGTNTTQIATTAYTFAGLALKANIEAPEFTGGGIRLPVGNTAARPTGANGIIRYNTQTNTFEGYAADAWGSIGGGATGGVGNAAFWENDIVISSNYTITAGKNAGTFGPITVADGVVVTVPDGSAWTVV